jgi:hypothetical protein
MHRLRKTLAIPDRAQTGPTTSIRIKLIKGGSLIMIFLGIVIASATLFDHPPDDSFVIVEFPRYSVDPEDFDFDRYQQKERNEACMIDPDLCDEGVLATIRRPELMRRLHRARECLKYGVLLKYGDCIEYDSIIDGLGRGEVAFNKPDRMEFRRPETIQLAIAPAPKRRSAAAALAPGLRGEIREADLALTRIMTAELRGAEGEFAISPQRPQERLVAGTEPVPWTWEVKPLVFGEDKRLTIEVMGVLRIGDERSPPRPVRTFVETFAVDVSLWNRMVYHLGQLAPVWGVPTALIAGGWALFLYAGRRRAAAGGNGSGGTAADEIARSPSIDPSRRNAVASGGDGDEDRDPQRGA